MLGLVGVHVHVYVRRASCCAGMCARALTAVACVGGGCTRLCDGSTQDALEQLGKVIVLVTESGMVDPNTSPAPVTGGVVIGLLIAAAATVVTCAGAAVCVYKMDPFEAKIRPQVSLWQRQSRLATRRAERRELVLE